MRLVVFDFCETLIKYQTADRFIDFVHQETKQSNTFWITVSRIASFRPVIIAFNKWLPNYNFGKRMRLLSLRSLPKKTLDSLSIQYAQKIKKDTIEMVMDKLAFHKEQGDHIIIISGGYQDYLEHFTNEFQLQASFGTRIQYKNGICTGLFEGPDCMHENKVKVLQNYIQQNSLKPREVVCYTDSISDLPILKVVDVPVVVSYKSPQKWAGDHNFKELIWH